MRCRAEVRIARLSSLVLPHFRRLPRCIDLRPLAVLQILVAKLTFILEVSNSALAALLVHVKEARCDGLRASDVASAHRLQLSDSSILMWILITLTLTNVQLAYVALLRIILRSFKVHLFHRRSVIAISWEEGGFAVIGIAVDI